MIPFADALAAVGIGLAGAGHCLGMCGGIASAISLGGQQSRGTSVAYHMGRVSSYALLGALIAALAGSINLAPWTLFLRYVAGFLLIAMGLSIANWWRGIGVLERAGARLWKPVQKISRGLFPIRNWRAGYLLGLCWGLMPCGLIYSALAWAATSQDAVSGGLRMLCFGIGTLPAMMAVSLGAAGIQAQLRRRGLKLIIALCLILAGVWTLGITYQHSGHLLHQGSTPTSHDEAHHGHGHSLHQDNSGAAPSADHPAAHSHR